LIYLDIFTLRSKKKVEKEKGEDVVTEYTLDYKDKYGNLVRLKAEEEDYEGVEIGDELDVKKILAQMKLPENQKTLPT